MQMHCSVTQPTCAYADGATSRSSTMLRKTDAPTKRASSLMQCVAGYDESSTQTAAVVSEVIPEKRWEEDGG
jgi:hypothetical protein